MKPFQVFLVGTGQVGSEFLRQFFTCRHSFTLTGVLNSTRAIVSESPRGIQCKGVSDVLYMLNKADPKNDSDLLSHLRECWLNDKLCAVIDCTASEHVASKYIDWIREGAYVITANKKGIATDMESYSTIEPYLANRTRYESTVGAGLPIISTLKRMQQTGDRIKSIEGIFSGTLSYIFNNISKDKPFSQVVREARKLGYTEPDPRNDLDGMDVARKAVILARTCGMRAPSPDEGGVNRESLIPNDLSISQVPDCEEFLQRLSELDEPISEKIQTALDEDQVVRYVGKVDFELGIVTAQLKKFRTNHPFANLTGTNNVISIKSDYYDEVPLVIQGPGAGNAVTAQGVLGDLLSLR